MKFALSVPSMAFLLDSAWIGNIMARWAFLVVLLGAFGVISAGLISIHFAEIRAAGEWTPAPISTPPPTLTPSPTPIPSVRAIYAIPSDMTYDARYERAISEALLNVQNWYSEQLDGSKFEIGEPFPQTCELEEMAVAFQGVRGFHKVIESVQHCAPVAGFSEWHTWVIYVDVPVPCEDGDTAPAFRLGRGGDGVVILHGGDVEGLLRHTYQPCPEWPLPKDGRWEGGLAHELGHAFGLPHPPECYASPETCGDQSLMWTGMYDYPDTFLREEDKEFLLGLSFFKGTQ